MATTCGKCNHKIKAKEVKYPLYPKTDKMHKWLSECSYCHFNIKRPPRCY